MDRLIFELNEKEDDMPTNTFDKISASLDKLISDSTLSIVPVLATKTGTVNSPAADTVPVIVPIIVPVSGTKTGTV